MKFRIFQKQILKMLKVKVLYIHKYEAIYACCASYCYAEVKHKAHICKYTLSIHQPLTLSSCFIFSSCVYLSSSSLTGKYILEVCFLNQPCPVNHDVFDDTTNTMSFSKTATVYTSGQSKGAQERLFKCASSLIRHVFHRR